MGRSLALSGILRTRVCRESGCLRVPPAQAQASGRGEGSPRRAGGHGPAGARGADRELRVPSRLEARRQLQHTFNSKLQTASLLSQKQHLKTDSRRLPRMWPGAELSHAVGPTPPSHLPNSEGGLVPAEACMSSLTCPPTTLQPQQLSHTFREASSHQRSQLQEPQQQEQQVPTSCQQAPAWHTGSQHCGSETAAPRFLLRPAST